MSYLYQSDALVPQGKATVEQELSSSDSSTLGIVIDRFFMRVDALKCVFGACVSRFYSADFIGPYGEHALKVKTYFHLAIGYWAEGWWSPAD